MKKNDYIYLIIPFFVTILIISIYFLTKPNDKAHLITSLSGSDDCLPCGSPEDGIYNNITSKECCDNCPCGDFNNSACYYSPDKCV